MLSVVPFGRPLLLFVVAIVRGARAVSLTGQDFTPCVVALLISSSQNADTKPDSVTHPEPGDVREEGLNMASFNAAYFSVPKGEPPSCFSEEEVQFEPP